MDRLLASSWLALLLEQTLSAAHDEVAWVLADDAAASCTAVCNECGGTCLEGEQAWPAGFSWRCADSKGQACSEPLAQAQGLYDLVKEPMCGWERDTAATPRTCASTGPDSHGRRFCPCAQQASETDGDADDASALPSPEGETDEVGSYSCSLRIDDHMRSVFYNGTDITNKVDNGENKWNSTRRVSFSPWPGARLVVFGEDNDGDFYATGGFWADCNGAPSQEISKAWEEFCSDDVIDAPHLRGDGGGWNPATFHSPGMWRPGTLGAHGKKYCVFRTVPLKAEGYRCDIRIDDYLRAVHYNGVDITKTVAGDLNRWDALRRISFPPLPGAYLVVYGKDWKGDFFGKGGFWADCDTARSQDLDRAWESFCSESTIPLEYQKGDGYGWTKPTFRANSHDGDEWAPGTLGDANKGHCVFRMMPVKLPKSPSPPSTTAAAPAESMTGASTTETPTTTEEQRPAPPDLPDGWRPVWVAEHKAYYFWQVSTNKTTWILSEVKAVDEQDKEQTQQLREQEEIKWNRPCQSQEECLRIVDEYLASQPRQTNLLLRTYGPGALDGGNCGELCKLTDICPTDPLLPGCRYDTYDNSVAAIYWTKRGQLDRALSILDSFTKLLYPESLEDVPKEVRYMCPSGKTLTLLAAAYTDGGEAKAGKYDGDGVYDGAVDAGNNAWAALAFVHYAAATGSECHAAIARDMLFALTSSAAACNDSLGGVRGRLEPWPRNYRSTEHNIDISALAKALDDTAAWNQTHRFVSSMFARNPSYNHSYAMGTGDEENCDPSQPKGPVPADCTYWNILADADPDRNHVAAALAFALRSPTPKSIQDQEGKNIDPNWENQQGMWTEDEDLIHPTGKTLYGTRFTTWGNGIQWEVTSGAAMAILHFSKKYGELEDIGGEVDLKHYVEKVRESLQLLLGMYRGVPGSVLGGNRDAWVRWTLKADKWKRDVPFPGGTDTGVSWSYLRYNHVASTAWAGLLMLYQGTLGGPVNEDINPLGKPLNMPKPGKDMECIARARKPGGGGVAGASKSEEDLDTDGKDEDEEEVTSTTTASTTTASSSVVLRTTTTLVTTSASTTVTTSSESTSVTTTSTTVTTTGEEAQFELWKKWKATQTKPPERLDEKSIVSIIKAPDPLGGDFGVLLDEKMLSVVGFTDLLAKAAGWRIGDRILTMDDMVVRGKAGWDERIASVKQTLLQGQDVANTRFAVLRMDLCSHSCYDLVHDMGRSCSSTWTEICGPDPQPYAPFNPGSPLFEFCPTECGTAAVQGPWTHLARPGTEVVVVTDSSILWQSGRTTPFTPVDSDDKVDQPAHTFATVFEGQQYFATLLDNGTLVWSDGDKWVRAAGAWAVSITTTTEEPEEDDSVAKGPWQCHHYVGNQGASPNWCQNVGWQDGFQFKYFGAESECSGCWCCKRQAPKPKPPPTTPPPPTMAPTTTASNTNALEFSDFEAWEDEHKDAADAQYRSWQDFRRDQADIGGEHSKEILRVLDQNAPDRAELKFSLSSPAEPWHRLRRKEVATQAATKAILNAPPMFYVLVTVALLMTVAALARGRLLGGREARATFAPLVASPQE